MQASGRLHQRPSRLLPEGGAGVEGFGFCAEKLRSRFLAALGMTRPPSHQPRSAPHGSGCTPIRLRGQEAVLPEFPSCPGGEGVIKSEIGVCSHLCAPCGLKR